MPPAAGAAFGAVSASAAFFDPVVTAIVMMLEGQAATSPNLQFQHVRFHEIVSQQGPTFYQKNPIRRMHVD